MFHFGIEINTDEFLWIHGNVGKHCWKWILRRFWYVEYWISDDDELDEWLDGLSRPS